jgi:hypothetical protein
MKHAFRRWELHDKSIKYQNQESKILTNLLGERILKSATNWSRKKRPPLTKEIINQVVIRALSSKIPRNSNGYLTFHFLKARRTATLRHMRRMISRGPLPRPRPRKALGYPRNLEHPPSIACITRIERPALAEQLSLTPHCRRSGQVLCTRMTARKIRRRRCLAADAVRLIPVGRSVDPRAAMPFLSDTANRARAVSTTPLRPRCQ